MKEEPSIGDELYGSVVALRGDNAFVVECSKARPGWSVVLRRRRDEPPVSVGDYVSTWVISVDHRARIAFVSASDFGRMPISDRMRPRYLRALKSVARVLEQERVPADFDPEQISDVKGMFSRCFKKDQWDWFTVYKSLGRPSPSDSKRAAETLMAFGRCVREKDQAKLSAQLQATAELGLVPLLLNAINTIEQDAPTLANARKQKTLEGSVPSSIVTKSDGLVLSTYVKDKLLRANATHQVLLTRLKELLEPHGYRIEANQFVDAYCHLKSGPAIFEAKSLTPENELAQIRHALSQLYEYRYRHKVLSASLWVLLSNKPQADWILDYLINDRGVCVMWLDGEEFAGPCLNRLTESGSAALARQRGAG